MEAQEKQIQSFTFLVFEIVSVSVFVQCKKCQEFAECAYHSF